jgi:hypothetical protein
VDWSDPWNTAGNDPYGVACSACDSVLLLLRPRDFGWVLLLLRPMPPLPLPLLRPKLPLALPLLRPKLPLALPLLRPKLPLVICPAHPTDVRIVPASIL